MLYEGALKTRDEAKLGAIEGDEGLDKRPI